MNKLTLSDFMFKKVRRRGEIAELIFDELDGKPVRLIGFECPAYYSDFEVRESGFHYFNELVDDTAQMKKEKGQ